MLDSERGSSRESGIYTLSAPHSLLSCLRRAKYYPPRGRDIINPSHLLEEELLSDWVIGRDNRLRDLSSPPMQIPMAICTVRHNHAVVTSQRAVIEFPAVLAVSPLGYPFVTRASIAYHFGPYFVNVVTTGLSELSRRPSRTPTQGRNSSAPHTDKQDTTVTPPLCQRRSHWGKWRMSVQFSHTPSSIIYWSSPPGISDRSVSRHNHLGCPDDEDSDAEA